MLEGALHQELLKASAALGSALKHGLLSQEVVVAAGGGAEDGRGSNTFLQNLHRDLKPEGLIEETLVERIVFLFSIRRGL